MGYAGAALTVDQTAICQQQETSRDRLKRVFRSSCDGIYRFILVRVGHDRHAADDLLQQTCTVAAGHRRVPDEDHDCEAWMFGIAKNLIRKHWRQLKKDQAHVSLSDVESSGTLVERLTSTPLSTGEMVKEESLSQLMRAMTSLPAVDQRLIFDFYFDGLSQAQMANAHSTTTKSIEAKLYRIRIRLRAILENHERNL